MKRRSALLEVPMGFGSMPDMSAIQRAVSHVLLSCDDHVMIV